MRLLTDPAVAPPVDCPYLPDRDFVQEYFFAADLDEADMQVLIGSGWRHFGHFFFRPRCPECRLCTPIRVDSHRLEPTRSQKRILRRGAGIEMTVVEPRATDEVWEVYRRHSWKQFGREPDREEFQKTFLTLAAPTLQTEYRVAGELAGVGFIDLTADGVSSIYFSFHPDWARCSLGYLSVFRESAYARSRDLRWYYLGYWVPGCPTMDYKKKFVPHQLYDWTLKKWRDAEAGTKGGE